MSGTLYLLPSGLGAAPRGLLPEKTLQVIDKTKHFVVEDAKAARAFLKSVGYPFPIQDARMGLLNEHTRPSQVAELLAPAEAGDDIALLSDAGCPAVADPGALLVRAAHERGIRVVPLVGPSAILMAIMASGMNGQRFMFHGYLPVEAEARRKRITWLEQESARMDVTQTFIETPYRNQAMYVAIIGACQKDTHLCLATDITCDAESIVTRTIGSWRSGPPPDLDRRPTVFVLYRGKS